MRSLTWAMLALLSAAIGAEFAAWGGPGQRALLRRAAAVLPPEHRDRYLEEWTAELNEMPNGPITRSLWASSILLRRTKIAKALGAPAGVSLPFSLKRGRDLVVSVGALFVFLPVLLAIGLAVRLTSRGPAISRQVRVGRDGRPFTMYMFRTMALDAKAHRPVLPCSIEVEDPLFKVGPDPGITRLGRILRRYSLDEMPQLVNVVLGHMSLVPSRPVPPS